MSLKDHYPVAYHQWAGNARGIKPDYDRCCASVCANGEYVSSQCRKKNGKGPDGAYCAQHDPDAVAKRNAEAKLRYGTDRHRRFISDTRGAVDIMRQIAEGHNDPRSLATAWLTKYAEILKVPEAPAVELPDLPPPPPPRVKNKSALEQAFDILLPKEDQK